MLDSYPSCDFDKHIIISMWGVGNSTPILGVHATARKNHLLSKQTTLNPQLTRATYDRSQTHSPTKITESGLLPTAEATNYN